MAKFSQKKIAKKLIFVRITPSDYYAKKKWLFTN